MHYPDSKDILPLIIMVVILIGTVIMAISARKEWKKSSKQKDNGKI